MSRCSSAYSRMHQAYSDTKLSLHENRGHNSPSIKKPFFHYSIKAYSVDVPRINRFFLTLVHVYVLLVQKVLTGAGEKWSEEEASQLLEDLMKYDTNGDGKFDYMGEYKYRGEASGQNIVK